MRLNSAYICVKDMRRAIQFYKNFLDQEITKEDEVFSMFNFHGFRLYLFNYSAKERETRYGNNSLLSFEVNDLEETKERVENLGAKIIYPITRIRNSKVFEFEDSEGNNVEVYQRIK